MKKRRKLWKALVATGGYDGNVRQREATRGRGGLGCRWPYLTVDPVARSQLPKNIMTHAFHLCVHIFPFFDFLSFVLLLFGFIPPQKSSPCVGPIFQKSWTPCVNTISPSRGPSKWCALFARWLGSSKLSQEQIYSCSSSCRRSRDCKFCLSFLLFIFFRCVFRPCVTVKETCPCRVFATGMHNLWKWVK